MRKRIFSAIACILMVLALLSPICHSLSPYGASVELFEYNGVTYTPHAPIRINSNADFDEAHGVVNWATGNGTVWNPWVIEGWDINGSGYGYCIYIGNTTNHFVINTCNIHEAIGGWNMPFFYNTGLTFYNAINGNIINTNLENCYDSGLRLIECEGFLILNNTANFNGWGGICLEECHNSLIVNNSVSNSWRGIYIDYCENINISFNFINTHNMSGLWLRFSNYSTLFGNQMLNDSISIGGYELSNWNTHIIDDSNTVNGKPIRYYCNQTGGLVFPGAGEVILANCTNMIVTNQDVSCGDYGILLGFSHRNVISFNIVENCSYQGITLYVSDFNTINNNRVKNIYMGGIRTYYSNNNSITNNTLVNIERAIQVDYSSDNVLMDNLLVNNTHGIRSTFSERTQVINNTLYYNLRHITISNSNDAMLTNNIIFSGNERFTVTLPCGIHIDKSDYCEIINNNLVNTSIHIWGTELNQWNTHNIGTSNYVNGKPVIYWCNQTGGTIPPGAGGVILANCSNVEIEEQNLSNGHVGIVLGFSDNNIVHDNKLENNGFAGIYFESSDLNTFYNNSISNNNWPVFIDSPGSDSAFNLIFHNDFVKNLRLPIEWYIMPQYWDNGYPSGGNYWSEYTGIDLKHGPLQNLDGCDGIGDTSFWADNYPLMMPHSYKFTTLNIQLSEGWNLISLPLELSNDSMNAVLSSIDGEWDCIRTYDSLTGTWVSNITNRPSQLNDFNTLSHKQGFWINITEPGGTILTCSGYDPPSTSINLYTGWNLVGYPSLNESMTIANALWGTGADIAMVCNKSEPYHIKEVGPTYVMRPGEGYWVHVPADTVWVVNW